MHKPLEENPEITGWLHCAAELSGEDGPIQTVSLQELSKMRSEWKGQQERTWKMLRTPVLDKRVDGYSKIGRYLI